MSDTRTKIPVTPRQPILVLVLTAMTVNEIDAETISEATNGTPLTQMRFDCRTKEVWTHDKRAWCCAHYDVGCPVVNSRDSSGGSGDDNSQDTISDLDTYEELSGVRGPAWTLGEIEAPAGERVSSDGTSTVAIYTPEQQRRLGVDEWGVLVLDNKTSSEQTTEIAFNDEIDPSFEFYSNIWHKEKCFCYNGTAVLTQVHAQNNENHHGWGKHHHHDDLMCTEGSRPVCEVNTHKIFATIVLLLLAVFLMTLCCQRFCCRKTCARLLGYGGVAASSKSIPSYFSLESDTELTSPIHYLENLATEKVDKFELCDVPTHKVKV